MLGDIYNKMMMIIVYNVKSNRYVANFVRFVCKMCDTGTTCRKPRAITLNSKLDRAQRQRNRLLLF